MRSVFWDDLSDDLKDPEYLREYVRESVRIATVDRIMNDLSDALKAQGLSKAEIARRLGREAASVRRLLSREGQNPTVGTIAETAAALGYRIELVPMSKAEHEQVTVPLRDGVLTATSR